MTKQILFYCKDCEEIVDTERCGRKYVYKCKKCGTKNVAFGTKKSIYSFFRLEDEEPEESSVETKVDDVEESNKEQPAGKEK